jgi:hypothetical protein
MVDEVSAHKQIETAANIVWRTLSANVPDDDVAAVTRG